MRKTINNIIKTLRLSTIAILYLGIFAFNANAADQKMVLQVDASLAINQQVEFGSAPFVLLEGEPSTLAEEGLGGYKVELLAERNQDKSYTVFSKIYNYTKSGYTLLGVPSLKLEYQTLGVINFESETAGAVVLELEIVKRAAMTVDTSDFGNSIR